MTPQEKAKELVDNYKEHIIETDDYFIDLGAKKCALIAVDEIFFALKYNLDGATSGSVKYWTEVKQEIEKI